MAITPIAEPLIGSQLIQFNTWHAIFWLLTVIGSDMISSLLLAWFSNNSPNYNKKTIQTIQ